MSMKEKDREFLEEKRNREIMDAARKLFYIHGFSGTTMEAIAEEAGISKGLIYHYFRSKEELLISFFRDMDDYLRGLEEVENPLEALIRFGTDFLVHDKDQYENASPTQLLLTTFASRELDVRKYEKQNPVLKDFGREYLGDFFRKGIEQQMFQQGDPEEYGDIYWSFLLGKLLTVKKGNENKSPEEYIREIMSVFKRKETVMEEI